MNTTPSRQSRSLCPTCPGERTGHQIRCHFCKSETDFLLLCRKRKCLADFAFVLNFDFFSYELVVVVEIVTMNSLDLPDFVACHACFEPFFYPSVLFGVYDDWRDENRRFVFSKNPDSVGSIFCVIMK